jgi:hypothetical protein
LRSVAASTARCLLGAYVPLLIANALTFLAAWLDAVSFHEVILLPPDPLSPARLLVGLVAQLAGYVGVYLAPGWLVLRAARWRAPNAVAQILAAFVVSLFSLSLAWIVVMSAFPGEAGRTCLYLTAGGLDALAILVALWALRGGTRGAKAPREGVTGAAAHRWREVVVPVAGILCLFVLAAWLMPGKILVESLEGDATEVCGFAASLFRGALPEWDLESGVWGFYPTFMFVSYPVFFSLAIGGISEAAVRLPAFVFLGVLLLAIADLAARGRARSAGAAPHALLPVLAAGYLSLQVGAYYAGYNPFHGDLGSSPLEEWAVTALAFCAVVLIRDGSPRLAAGAALLSLLTFPSGLMLVALLGFGALVFASREQRGVVLHAGAALAILVTLYAVFLVLLTLARGTFGAMLGEWYAKYFAGRASFGEEDPRRIAEALGWFVLLCGGLPALGFLTAFARGERVARWLATAAALWVGFFLLSPGKNIHYFMPAALVPVALVLRSRLGREWFVSAVLVVSILTCIVLCRPRVVTPYTADREFGRRTLFLARSEREAVDCSRVLFNLTKPLWTWRRGDPWSIGHHTWVLYADRALVPERDYDFYVGLVRPAAVAGLIEITRVNLPSGPSAVLWSPGGRAAFREWKLKEYPLRDDLSRFNFRMDAPARRPARRRAGAA